MILSPKLRHCFFPLLNTLGDSPGFSLCSSLLWTPAILVSLDSQFQLLRETVPQVPCPMLWPRNLWRRQAGANPGLLVCLPSLRDHVPSLPPLRCFESHCILYYLSVCFGWKGKFWTLWLHLRGRGLLFHSMFMESLNPLLLNQSTKDIRVGGPRTCSEEAFLVFLDY